jgi:hypothetical protein
MQAIFDSNAGGRLGEALGTGLNKLAENKLAQISQQYQGQQERSRFAQGLAPILGQDTANFLSNLGPDERKYALQNIGSLMQLNQQPGQQQQMGGMAALGAQQQPQQQMTGQQPKEQQQMAPDRTKLVQDIFTSPQEKREREKLELAKRTLARKEAQTKQMNADKETKKYFESALDLEKAADFSDIRLKKMENLVKKGRLPISGFYNLFKNLEESVAPAYGAAAGAAAGGYTGGPLGAAIGSAIGGLISPIGTLLRFAQKQTSPDTEEFEKLSNDFIKDAKAIFGSRITDNDLKAFMATVPTLGQTDAGKLAIINNMKMFNKASRIRAEAVKDVIRKNGNRRPHNLQILVEDRIKPQLDQLSQEFSVV